ncbi:hypothetical protein AYI70_g8353 [Smittium culicis]|uniref:Uncharacterized protein n=1 Tax=Smittium culicis TaxID=133412 RepID=A0A1R1XGD5_9FUNG|nr:hypothetical protein AYI70_g8353 [Smittium culicis]
MAESDHIDVGEVGQDEHIFAQGQRHRSGDEHAGNRGEEFRYRETRRAILNAAAQLPARRHHDYVLDQRSAPPLPRPHVCAPENVQFGHIAVTSPTTPSPTIKQQQQWTGAVPIADHEVPRTDYPQFG